MRDRVTLVFAIVIIPAGALAGLNRAFHMLDRLHIWAAYGNFFAFLTVGLMAAYLAAGRD